MIVRGNSTRKINVGFPIISNRIPEGLEAEGLKLNHTIGIKPLV